jgi:beta-lactamase class A
MRLTWRPISLILLAAVPVLLAQEDRKIKPPDSLIQLLNEKLGDRIEEIDEEQVSGVLGFCAIDLNTGARISYNENAVFPQASLIKVPILAELFRVVQDKQLRLDDSTTLQPTEGIAGSSFYQLPLKAGPVTTTYRQLATAMIQVSDNTATNHLIAKLGMSKVNENMVRLGLPNTKLQRIMLDGAAAKADRENLSTPYDMARLFQLIYQGKVGGEAGAKEMITIMEETEEDIRTVVPGNIRVASKPGRVPGARTEGAIVFLDKRPYVLTVMASFLESEENPIPIVARLVHDHFVKLASSNSYGNRLP